MAARNTNQGGSMKKREKDTCKKKDCVNYESYKTWNCGDWRLDYCMNCKWAHVSQFTAKPKTKKP